MGINETIRITVEFVGIDDCLWGEDGIMDEDEHVVGDQFYFKV